MRLHNSTHSILSPQHCVRFASLQICGRRLNTVVRRATEKSAVLLRHCATTHPLLCLAHLAYRHRSLVGGVMRSSTLLVKKLSITWRIKIDLRTCFSQTVMIHLVLLLEQHSPQCVSNLCKPHRNPNFISITDGEDEESDDS